jgi:ferric-dicitrate binding protein FerR (iron transport regulator)
MKESEKYNVPIDLISRVLSGEADSSDLANLENWKNESEDNKKILEQYRTLWEKTGDIKAVDEINIEEEWARFKISRKTRSLSPLTRIAAAAAVLIILAISSLLTYNSLSFEKIKAVAVVSEVTLPDGSLVTLYPGAAIKYKKSFGDKSRKLILDGEAFFDVVRDTLRTFSLSAGDMLVEVLGTSFNVEAYSSSGIYNVIVEEGRVAVSNATDPGISAILAPGEKASFSDAGKSILKSVNEDINFNAWRTRKIVFDNSGLDEVASTLSKVFLKDISFIGKNSGQSLTVSFEDKSLEYILETIKATLDITIDRKEEKIIIR